MQLTYVNTVKSLIVAHLDAGETIPKSPDPPVCEGPGTFYISVDGSREDYRALLKMDPTLADVADPNTPPESVTKAIEAKAKKADEAKAAAAKAAAPAPNKAK